MDLMREVQLEREVEQEQEDAETRRIRYENQVKNATSIEQLEMILREKYNGDGSVLRVYIDRDNEKYYIDTFAAYSLCLLSYQQASERFDAGGTLYEISPAMLKMLESVFKGRIEYQYLPSKRDEEKITRSDINDLTDNYNDILKKYKEYTKMDTEGFEENHRKSKEELEDIFKPNRKDLMEDDDYIDLSNHKYNK